jgi:antibiotic biosynthesis monooxygenase (ABM) superfamily enzyme
MTRSWLAAMVTTLAAWLVAFLVVMSLLTFLGHELNSLPLAARASAISGVMVTLMVNVVMPRLLPIAARIRSADGRP